ncbi:transposase [Paenibacillus sp. WST5]|uniref:Transposase n=1 Tax=Paenibacillus sedimenti TaxID=2770274 RepID=A0A926QM10_9BACL|nr:transposase [Paenibacillus sedimenti]
MRGVAEVTATTLVAEIGQFIRFTSPRQLSYTPDLFLMTIQVELVVGKEDVDQRYFIPLSVRSDGVMQGYILTRFLKRTQMHQDLVLDTTSRKCRELRPLRLCTPKQRKFHQ